MRENVDYKTDSNYQKLSDEDKAQFDEYVKKVVSLNEAQKDRMACIVALVVALKSTSPFELRYDTVKKVVDLAFDAGQLNVFRTILTEIKNHGIIPKPSTMILGYDVVVMNFNKTRGHLVNMIKELELKTDKVSTEEEAKGL